MSKFRKGDKIFLKNFNRETEYMFSGTKQATAGATAVVEGYRDHWLVIKWNKKDKRCEQQANGGYYEEHFELLKNKDWDTEENEQS